MAPSVHSTGVISRRVEGQPVGSHHLSGPLGQRRYSWVVRFSRPLCSSKDSYLPPWGSWSPGASRDNPWLCSGLTGSLSPAPMPPQPEELTNILEICNVVFTSMFALGMLLKLAAFGLFDYLRNPYNIFDSAIVIIRCCPAPAGCGPRTPGRGAGRRGA